MYAIRAGEYVKIGTTNDLKRRLAAIRSVSNITVSPPDADLKSAMIVGYMLGDRAVEAAMHDAFWRYHAVGEWFHWNQYLARWCALRLQLPMRGLDAPTHTEFAF